MTRPDPLEWQGRLSERPVDSSVRQIESKMLQRMISATLLAGGRSLRMGRDKCLLEMDGIPLWRRQIELLRGLSDDVFIVSPLRPAWAPESQRWIPDAAQECGPLGGVTAALAHAVHPLVLVLAVDLPEMTSDYLRALVAQAGADRGVVPVIDGLFQPLSAVYPAEAHAAASAQLCEPDKSLQRLLRRLITEGKMTELPVEPNDRPLFRNLNAASD